MSDPSRVRLSRRRGWRKPPAATVVARPSRWGNPFAVRPSEDGRWAVVERGVVLELASTAEEARAAAVERFRVWAPGHVDASPLWGRDLACWCPPDGPCHADVLLELANATLRPR